MLDELRFLTEYTALVSGKLSPSCMILCCIGGLTQCGVTAITILDHYRNEDVQEFPVHQLNIVVVEQLRVLTAQN